MVPAIKPGHKNFDSGVNRIFLRFMWSTITLDGQLKQPVFIPDSLFALILGNYVDSFYDLFRLRLDSNRHGKH